MERRHFIKLIAIFTAIFPFLKKKPQGVRIPLKKELAGDPVYEDETFTVLEMYSNLPSGIKTVYKWCPDHPELDPYLNMRLS